MRGRLFLFLGLLVLSPAMAQVEEEPEATPPAPRPPNIVVIMADDHAQWATGTYGLDAPATTE